MWIWISAGWLCCGVVAYLMLRNACLRDGTWDVWLMSAAILVGMLGYAAPFLALICEGKNCFRRRKKMEKTYWNEKEKQFMTKGGACLYDKNSMHLWKSSIEQRLRAMEGLAAGMKMGKQFVAASDASKIQGQLACAHKGHKMVYEKAGTAWVYYGQGNVGKEKHGFVFKCSSCGLEITKTKKELTPSEREALRKLKVI